MFPKNKKANLTLREEEVFRDAAKILANVGSNAINLLITNGEWIEIDYEQHQKDASERSASVGSSGDKGASQGRRNR